MKYLKWIFPILVLYFIFGSSLMNGNHSGSLSLKLASFLYLDNNFLSFEQFHFLLRKIAHFTEFFILAASFVFACFDLSYDIQSKIYLFTFVFPFLDETLQLFSKGRNGSMLDVLIDSCGMLLCYLCYHLCLKMLKKTVD